MRSNSILCVQNKLLLCVAVMTTCMLGTSCIDGETSDSFVPTDAQIAAILPLSSEQLGTAFDNLAKEYPNIGTDDGDYGALLYEHIQKAKSQSGMSVTQGIQNLEPDPDDIANITKSQVRLLFDLINKIDDTLMKLCFSGTAPPAKLEQLYYFFNSNGNDRGDAFRHANWSARLARACGQDLAEKIATAHEDGATGNTNLMDLNNNAVGRLIAQDRSGRSISDLILDYPIMFTSNPVVKSVARLVYIRNAPKVDTFDSGPDLDDIYVTNFTGQTTTTPKGGVSTLAVDEMLSGSYSLDVTCAVDGTKGGCGVAIHLRDGLSFADGSASTTDVIQQGEKLTYSVKMLTLRGSR